MSLKDGLIAFKRAFSEKKYTLKNLHQGGGLGVKVNSKTALSIPAYFAAINKISKAVKQLPLEIYEKTDEGRVKAVNHPLYDILHNKTNDLMTSATFQYVTTAHEVSWGNGRAYIHRDGKYGKILGLYPLKPWNTETVIEKGKVITKTTIGGKVFTAEPWQIIHTMGFTEDGLVGLSMFKLFSETIEHDKHLAKYGRLLFKNGLNLGGLFKHPKTMSKEAQKRFETSIKSKQGIENSHKYLIIEEGMEYLPNMIKPEDAQAIESRRYSLLDFCRIFDIPPHKLGHLADATFSNVEHMNIDFVVDTLIPILRGREQEYNIKLLDKEERKKYVIEYNVKGLLRGDIATRGTFYQLMTQLGIMSADEVRALEGMNAQPKGQGKVYLAPLNYVNKLDLIDPPEDKEPLKESKRSVVDPSEVSTRARGYVAERRKVSSRYKDKIGKAVQSVLNKELKEIRSYLESKEFKSNDIEGWMRDFYSDFEKEIRKKVTPVFSSFGADIADVAKREIDSKENLAIAKMVKGYVRSFAKSYSESSKGQIRSIINSLTSDEDITYSEDEIRENIESRLSEWEEKRVGKLSRRNMTNGRNAFTLAAWQLGGIVKKTWVTNGKSCPFCNSLNGTTVEITKHFLKPGDSIGKGKQVMNITKTIGHAGCHDGCDCDMVPGG